MNNEYQSTQGTYVFSYSKGVFKASSLYNPDVPILEVATDKIKSLKDFEKEIMWQQASLNSESEYETY
tara:strand:+ start:3878 stop:4081 length:204 start_codon:yes stop_codon:yes gene_type:complete